MSFLRLVNLTHCNKIFQGENKKILIAVSFERKYCIYNVDGCQLMLREERSEQKIYSLTAREIVYLFHVTRL